MSKLRSEASALPAVMTKPMPTAVMDRDDEPFATETSTTTDGVIDTDAEEAATELPADGAGTIERHRATTAETAAASGTFRPW